MTDQQDNPPQRHPALTEDVFASWLNELAECITRQELSGKKASEHLRQLAEEIEDPEGKPGEFVQSLKLGGVFMRAEEEEKDPEPHLVDFIAQLEQGN